MDTVPLSPDCPPWCTVDHQNVGPKFHALCAGEVLRKHGSVVVVVTHEDDADGVELAYHMQGKRPSVALLSEPETRELRDYLTGALEILDPS